MTLEKIVAELSGFTADQWESLTDTQLEEKLKPCLCITRPEQAALTRSVSKQTSMPFISPAKANALKLLADQGIDISDLMRKKRKK